MSSYEGRLARERVKTEVDGTVRWASRQDRDMLLWALSRVPYVCACAQRKDSQLDVYIFPALYCLTKLFTPFTVLILCREFNSYT